MGPFTGPLTTAKQWRHIFFRSTGLLNILAISGWEADPDGDGLTNLVEMSLGTHPLVLNDDVRKVPNGETRVINDQIYASVSFDKDPSLWLDYAVRILSYQHFGKFVEEGVVVDQPEDLLHFTRFRAESSELKKLDIFEHRF